MGQRRCIYIADSMVPYYKYLSPDGGASLSERVADCVRNQAVASFMGVRVTAGAYAALAVGDFGALTSCVCDGNVRVIALSDDAVSKYSDSLSKWDAIVGHN